MKYIVLSFVFCVLSFGLYFYSSYLLQTETKAKKLNRLAALHERSTKENLCNPSLDLAENLMVEITADEAVYVADRVVKIRRNAWERLLEVEKLESNQTRTIEILEFLLTKAEDRRYSYADVDVHFAQFYLGMQYKKVAREQQKPELLQRAAYWIDKSNKARTEIFSPRHFLYLKIYLFAYGFGLPLKFAPG